MYSTGFRWVPEMSEVQVNLFAPCGVQYILFTGVLGKIMTAHRVFLWLHLLACHVLLSVHPGLPLHYRFPRDWQGFHGSTLRSRVSVWTSMTAEGLLADFIWSALAWNCSVNSPKIGPSESGEPMATQDNHSPPSTVLARTDSGGCLESSNSATEPFLHLQN